MGCIVPIAVLGILALLASGAVPLSGVGGAMTIGLVMLAAVPAVGIYEAWTNKRSLTGWIVNIFVSVAAAFLVAPIAGMVMVILVSPFMDTSSLAAAGGGVMYVAFAGTMAIMLLGARGAVRIVNRSR